MNYNWKSDCQL